MSERTNVPVILVEESFSIVLLVIEPVHALGYELFPRLLALAAAGHRGGQAGVVLGDGVPAPRRDQVPDEGLDVLVAPVGVQAVQQGETHSVLRTKPGE